MKNKLKEIGDGWINALLQNNDVVEEEAQRRLAICNQCPTKVNIGFDVCGDCYCPLVAKTRSKDSECPLQKW